MPGREIRDEKQAEMIPGQEQELPPEQPQESILIPLDERMQRVAVRIVHEDFRASKASRDSRDYGRTSKGEVLNHEKWLKELKDLYFGNRLPKDTPWKYCSNRSMMIAMAILDTLHARMFPGIYNEDLLKWRPSSAAFTDRVERIEKLMNWWVRVHCNLHDFFDRWTKHVLGFGRVLTESMWDVQLIDKGEMSQPGIDPVTGLPLPPEKVLERLEKSVSYIVPEEDIFLQPGATDIQRDPAIIRKVYLYRELEELEREGKVQNVTTPSAEGVRTVKDVLIVSGSSSVSGLNDQETEELLNIKRRNMPVTVLQWYGGIDLDMDGFPEQLRQLACADYEIFLGAVSLASMTKRGLRPLDLTLFEQRLDEPQGLHGIGILEKVKELALEIDAIFNQMTDANSLSILRPGFYDPSGTLNAGELKLSPNKWTAVENAANSIYVPQIDIPTERLIMAVKLVLEFIERLTAASSYIMGKESEVVGGSGTATRTNAIVGAANERNAIPIQRLKQGAARIINGHLDLVQVNLPPDLEERILGPNNEPLFAANELSQESISGEYEAYLLPDDTLGSKESQRQLSQLLYTTLFQNYLIASDPTKVYTLTADFLKSYGQDPVHLLGPEPPARMAKTPSDENFLILSGDHAQVRATVLDNPMEHILEHQSFLQSPAVAMMDPLKQQEVIQYTMHHIQEHMQMIQLIMAASSKMGGKQGGSPNGAEQGGDKTGGRQPAAPVGPESGMGGGQNPLTATLAGKGAGESSTPA